MIYRLLEGARFPIVTISRRSLLNPCLEKKKFIFVPVGTWGVILMSAIYVRHTCQGGFVSHGADPTAGEAKRDAINQTLFEMVSGSMFVQGLITQQYPVMRH